MPFHLRPLLQARLFNKAGKGNLKLGTQCFLTVTKLNARAVCCQFHARDAATFRKICAVYSWVQVDDTVTSKFALGAVFS